MILIITIGVVIYVIIPSIQKIKELSSSIYEKRTEMEKMYVEGQYYKKSLSTFNQIKSELEELNKIFVQKGNEIFFVTNIEEIASLHNVDQTIKLGAQIPVESETNTPLGLQITLQGDFENLIEYLAELEQINYYINIDSIRLSTDSSSLRIKTDIMSENFLGALITANIYLKDENGE